MGLSDGMVWSLEFDDFKGKCDERNYPLLTKIYDMLNDKLKDYMKLLLSHQHHDQLLPGFGPK